MCDKPLLFVLLLDFLQNGLSEESSFLTKAAPESLFLRVKDKCLLIFFMLTL